MEERSHSVLPLMLMVKIGDAILLFCSSSLASVMITTTFVVIAVGVGNVVVGIHVLLQFSIE